MKSLSVAICLPTDLPTPTLVHWEVVVPQVGYAWSLMAFPRVNATLTLSSRAVSFTLVCIAKTTRPLNADILTLGITR